jgi:plastocyanin
MRRVRPRLVAALAAAALVPAARGGDAATLTGSLTIDGTRSADAVVALRSGRPASEAAARAPRAIMDQKHLSFRPKVLPVARGTVVEFKNSDDVEHNVFSPSTTAGAFDLGTYGSGQSREVAFERAGEVRVLCNIHMEMEAHILVLDEPWAAVTSADGGFEIRDLPPGEYAISVWSEAWLRTEQSVTVPETGDVRVDVAVRR